MGPHSPYFPSRVFDAARFLDLPCRPACPPAAHRSVDGSMSNDIPAQQLALLFHCTRVVVSQTNPHVLPFLRRDDSDSGAHRTSRPGGAPSGSLDAVLHALEGWVHADVGARAAYLVRLKLLPRVFGAELVSQVCSLPSLRWGVGGSVVQVGTASMHLPGPFVKTFLR